MVSPLPQKKKYYLISQSLKGIYQKFLDNYIYILAYCVEKKMKIDDTYIKLEFFSQV